MIENLDTSRSVGISALEKKKVDVRYEWREAAIENGITRNLSTFVRAYRRYLRLAIVCRLEFYGRRDSYRERDGVSYDLYTEKSLRFLLRVSLGTVIFSMTIDLKMWRSSNESCVNAIYERTFVFPVCKKKSLIGRRTLK